MARKSEAGSAWRTCVRRLDDLDPGLLTVLQGACGVAEVDVAVSGDIDPRVLQSPELGAGASAPRRWRRDRSSARSRCPRHEAGESRSGKVDVAVEPAAGAIRLDGGLVDELASDRGRRAPDRTGRIARGRIAGRCEHAAIVIRAAQDHGGVARIHSRARLILAPPGDRSFLQDAIRVRLPGGKGI
jgi:hypothetical protein